MKLIVATSFFLLAGIATAETRIVDPEWTIKDDFEGKRDSSFWVGGHNGGYGRACPGSIGTKGPKTITFEYDSSDPGVTEPGHSWAEFRFKLPLKTTQLEMSYDIYVPSNYRSAKKNHKFFQLWGGNYGGFNANVQIGSEIWPTAGGGTPSLNLSIDKSNMGHSMLSSKRRMFIDDSGAWQRIQVYVELATGPGDFGKVEIYKNGEFLTGTDHADIVGRDYAPSLPTQIKYSKMGNALEKGYLLGWMNEGPMPGVKSTFCIDNFEMNLRSTVGSTNKSTAAVPVPPAGIKLN